MEKEQEGEQPKAEPVKASEHWGSHMGEDQRGSTFKLGEGMLYKYKWQVGDSENHSDRRLLSLYLG